MAINLQESFLLICLLQTLRRTPQQGPTLSLAPAPPRPRPAALHPVPAPDPLLTAAELSAF